MKTPFTILTGFLGTGKTTVVNRVLSAPQGRRIAVLVNELGRVSIDSQLIVSRGGDVLELAGGCVCCKLDVKNDLWDGIADVVRRSRPDAVLLETTGIAEPPAIFEGLQRVDEVSRAGVVCVVDADGAAAAVKARDEARIQVECADRVLLSKLDVASAQDVEATHRVIAGVNASAERASFPLTDAGTHALTPWLLDKRSPSATPIESGHLHTHHTQVTSVSLVEHEPLVLELVMELLEEIRPTLLRAKGFVYVAGDSRRAFVELAGRRLGSSWGQMWAGTSSPRTELVLIGDELDEPTIRRRLWACRAADSALT